MMYEQDANQKAHPLTMAGNRHYAKARETGEATERRAVEAALAQAFEQRTANLIALVAHDRIGGYVAPADLYKTIEARMGL